MRRSALRNRRQALGVRSAQYPSTVMLIRARGGGRGVARESRITATRLQGRAQVHGLRFVCKPA